MLLNGKVAVVTGASMGIGEAIAKLFVNEGASVVLSSRELGRAEMARGRIGLPERTMAVACDVRNREEIERLMTLAVHNFGQVDIWINNAGHGLMDSVVEMDMGQCRSMFNTNLFGAIDGMQVAAAQMKQQGSGAIINISSVAGHIPLPYSAAYSATKFALNAITRGARMELAKRNIRVINVCPGYIATNFGNNIVRGAKATDRVVSPIHGISPDRVARAVLRGYLKNKREIVVPWKDRMFIKLYQLWPGLIEYGLMHLKKSAEPASAKAAPRP